MTRTDSKASIPGGVGPAVQMSNRKGKSMASVAAEARERCDDPQYPTNLRDYKFDTTGILNLCDLSVARPGDVCADGSVVQVQFPDNISLEDVRVRVASIVSDAYTSQEDIQKSLEKSV